MLFGCPAIEQHDLTHKLVESITRTIARPQDFTFVIIDNASKNPYTLKEFSAPFKIEIIRYEENLGYYLPLKFLYEKYPDELIGLIHNDIIFYEEGWDRRIDISFRTYPKLGLMGFVGSNQVDYAGGRGFGTIMNFQGPGQAGRRTDTLEPAIILDSLFMLFRREVIPLLKIDNEITPCHFYDRIWSLRTIENKYYVAVLGVLIDHVGGSTSCADEYQRMAYEWCKKHNIPLNGKTGDQALYAEGERRLLTEYKDKKKMIPGWVDQNFDTYGTKKT